MSRIKLSYSTFGLTRRSIIEAINAVADAGYPAIELAFHRENFNPFQITDDLLDKIRQFLRIANKTRAERRKAIPSNIRRFYKFPSITA